MRRTPHQQFPSVSIQKLSQLSSLLEQGVEHGENGFLTLEDPIEWSECIEKLLDDTALLNRMRQNARITADAYSESNIAGQPEHYYLNSCTRSEKKPSL